MNDPAKIARCNKYGMFGASDAVEAMMAHECAVQVQLLWHLMGWSLQSTIAKAQIGKQVRVDRMPTLVCHCCSALSKKDA